MAPDRAAPLRLRGVALRAEPTREEAEEDEDASPASAYALTGRLASGKMATLSFSEIDSFVVKSKTPEKAWLSVTIWPDISARKLLAKKPSYTQLLSAYRKVVEIEIDLKSSDGRPLVLAETGGLGSAVPLERLPAGAKVDFHGEDVHEVHPRELWWAIPSVIKDPAYPFRLAPAKS